MCQLAVELILVGVSNAPLTQKVFELSPPRRDAALDPLVVDIVGGEPSLGGAPIKVEPGESVPNRVPRPRQESTFIAELCICTGKREFEPMAMFDEQAAFGIRVVG